MKPAMKYLLTIALASFCQAASAAVFMAQRTEGGGKLCKYSDGTVVQLSFSLTCPAPTKRINPNCADSRALLGV